VERVDFLAPAARPLVARFAVVSPPLLAVAARLPDDAFLPRPVALVAEDLAVLAVLAVPALEDLALDALPRPRVPDLAALLRVLAERLVDARPELDLLLPVDDDDPPPLLDVLSSSPPQRPERTLCAASATASAMIEPSRVALETAAVAA
jgi:hypothetical protein